MNQVPMWEKDNEMTRLIAQVNAHNAAKGAGIARNRAPMRLTSEAPRVTTGAMRADPFTGEPPPVISSLSPEEVARRDALLRGEMSGGAIPASPPPVQVPSYTSETPTLLETAERQYNVPPVPTPSRMNSFMPDLSRIQSIDLEHNAVIVDGVAFPLPRGHEIEMKAHAAQLVIQSITQQVARAIVAFEAAAEEAKNVAANLQQMSTANETTEVQEVQEMSEPENAVAERKPRKASKPRKKAQPKKKSSKQSAKSGVRKIRRTLAVGTLEEGNL